MKTSRAGAIVSLAGAALVMGCQGGGAMFCLSDADCGGGMCSPQHMCLSAEDDAPSRTNREVNDRDGNAVTRSDGRTVWTLELDRGHIVGDLGDVMDYDEQANTMVGEYDGTYTTVTLLSERGDEAMMSIVRFRGELSEMNLEKGVPTSIPGNMGTVVGCSGDPSDGWDFDEPADDVIVTMEEPEEGRRSYNIVATFGDQTMITLFDTLDVQ